MVPELTPCTGIQLNGRVSLRRHRTALSSADDARAPFECRLDGRLGCRGRGLALVPARFRQPNFRTLNQELAVAYLTVAIVIGIGAAGTFKRRSAVPLGVVY